LAPCDLRFKCMAAQRRIRREIHLRQMLKLAMIYRRWRYL